MTDHASIQQVKEAESASDVSFTFSATMVDQKQKLQFHKQNFTIKWK